MIFVGIKDISKLCAPEIRERAERFSPFYRDYILSPMEEKQGEVQEKHSAQRLANVELLHRFCKQQFAKSAFRVNYLARALTISS